jgi:hypothetical protein
MTSLMETFGTIIAPIRVFINAGLQQLAESLQSVLAPAAEYAKTVLANIGPIMDWVKEKVIQGIGLIVGAFTFLETILTNLGSVWELVRAYAESAMLGVSGTVMHALTVVVPAYAKWFAENFVNLMRDGLMAAFTVVSNHIKKIVDAFQALWNFIASGLQTDVLGQLGEISGRSYLEGFQSSLTALPQIAARQLSQREQDLADKMAKIGGRLGTEFSQSFEERMTGLGSSLSDEMSSAAKGIDLKGRPGATMNVIQATQGRLLTRGPGTSIPNLMQEIIQLLKNPPPPKPPGGNIHVQIDSSQMQTWEQIRDNTSKTLQMEAIA